MKATISGPEEMLETSVELPLSKSMSVRAVAMAATGAKLPDALAQCADVDAMQRVAAARTGSVDAGDSGAALRFGMALLAATEGADVTITGSPRLMERPVEPLIDALQALGADVERTAVGIHVRGKRLAGGRASFGEGVSSQYISALLLAAPLMDGTLDIEIDWNQPSLPYIDMTLGMMRSCGIDAQREGRDICVRPGAYTENAPEIERDWSAAAFWYETAALTAGFVDLPGLTADSLQGDRAVAGIFTRLGVVTSFDAEGAHLCADPEMHARLDLDCSATPDLVPALAVSAALLGMPFELSGVAALAHKESDRLQALVSELAKLGILASAERGTLSWDGSRVPVLELPEFSSHADHRIAMALAPVSVFVPGITIDGIECVDKSYPEFLTHLAEAGFAVEESE